MSKGLCHRTAYLSCTRGEGGQNLLGPEQGFNARIDPDPGTACRTAHRWSGNSTLLVRNRFWFLKKLGGNFAVLGKEKTLSDVVWVIRTFRPDVIVTRFTPTLGGHGIITASASLAYTAFRAAADSHAFPKQLRFTAPWQAKRLVWNAFRFFRARYFPGNRFTRSRPTWAATTQYSASPLRKLQAKQEHAQEPGIRRIAIPRGIYKLFSTCRRRHSEKRSFTTASIQAGRGSRAEEIVQQTLRRSESNFDDNNPAQSIPVLLKAARCFLTYRRNHWYS